MTFTAEPIAGRQVLDLSFLPMNTAMGLWRDPAPAVAKGVLSPPA